MKYTRFCTAQALVRHIQSPQKDEQATHILLSIFKKPLTWLEQKYDRETLLDSINAITIHQQQPIADLAWMFVIEGGFTYLEMVFGQGQFARVGAGWQPGQVKLLPSSKLAVLDGQAMRWLKGRNQERQKQRIVRFLKQAVFYPYYIEQQLVRQFAMLSRVKTLPFGKALNWKDEDGSCKLGVVYKGVVGIEYQWKRRLQLAQITRGMFLANRYIRDEVEEMDDVSLQPLRDGGEPAQHPQFDFIGRAEETVLLIFNLRLISESPYNVNPDLRGIVKRQFQKYTLRLAEVRGFEEEHKLHRNKRSIKQELKRRKEKETIDLAVTQEMMDPQKKLSPILRTYSLLNQTTSTIIQQTPSIFPEPPRQFSHTVFTSISSPRLARSKTTPSRPFGASPSQTRSALVHNTWVQQMSRKPKNIKSFSTLRSLSTFHSDRHKHQAIIQQQLTQGKQPKFFLPNQFVKRKLKLKYQNLLSKVQDLDLALTTRREETVGERMKRLESYVDSKRIVRLNTMKGKHKLMRDKVQY